MPKVFRGISHNQETIGSLAYRDTRPLWQQVRDVIKGRFGASITMIVFAGLMLIVPWLADVIFIIQVLLFWYVFWTFKFLPFKMPIYSHKPDKHNPKPGTNTPGPATGIYFFGNDLNTKEQLWFNNADMRTHVLIFGSTGSGKTEMLLSISYNALIQGSGFIYVDGKGDNALYAKVFSMVRMMGRTDDLLVVNFMTGAADIIGPQENILSNTMNPFAAGSSSMLSQLVVSMMESSSQGSTDGDMWKGRAISFIEALMRPLVYLRDHGFLLLEAGVIRKYFTLDALEDLLFDKKVIDQNNSTIVMEKGLPFEVRDPLDNYLASLPGYRKSDKGKQSGKAYEQHGYITMQLTRIFGSLADVYGHIVRTNLAEVDFKDVVLNRRILVVLLPALEKSPEELSNLGKLIIASLKAMLAAGLGEKIEGDFRDVIETKPTNSNTPFLCILDEYGYYAVKGFAVVPAQARSLGFSVVFAGQDLPAFQKASKEEAASICANTNIKICMKLEDPMETWEFFQKTAGETYVTVAKSFNKPGDSTLSYRDTMEASLDRRGRVDLLDLKDQREGEFHIFFKSNIIRAKTFYADPPKVAKIKLNQFLKVKPPSDQTTRFLKKLKTANVNSQILQLQETDENLIELFEIFDKPAVKEDVKSLYKTIFNYLDGHVEEEVMDFGDQSNNPSIFMSIPADERLGSEFFDVEVSNLQESLLTKEKLYELVKKLNIMAGKSETISQSEAMDIINKLEKETDYSKCFPDKFEDIPTIIDDFLNTVTTK